eukprot:scpid85551/ scgid13451/ 
MCTDLQHFFAWAYHDQSLTTRLLLVTGASTFTKQVKLSSFKAFFLGLYRPESVYQECAADLEHSSIGRGSSLQSVSVYTISFYDGMPYNQVTPSQHTWVFLLPTKDFKPRQTLSSNILYMMTCHHPFPR